MKILPSELDGHAIRRVYDEETETWWFSVVDIVQVLTQQPGKPAGRKTLKKPDPHDNVAEFGGGHGVHCNG